MCENCERGDSVGAYEAKTHLSALLERVQNGEEIIITKHGAPIARLVPIASTATTKERRAAIERLLARREKLSLGDLRISELIAEGRR